MKCLSLFMILAALTVNLAFADSFEGTGETSTECPMMREQNERNNPKLNIGQIKVETKTSKQAVAQ